MNFTCSLFARPPDENPPEILLPRYFLIFRKEPICTLGTFFLFFLKDNVMLEHFELQAVSFVRCKAEFVLQRKRKQGGIDYAEIHGKD
ncbi:MAG: hypothetical protein D3914_13870 [Candidatus Electrothrix sp. LOE2]|nr:hypothetical protein [Candidatus Electrothrix sp. LOE2]